MGLIRKIPIKSDRSKIQVHPSCLHVVGIQIDDNQDHVGIVRAALAVADHVLVVGRVEGEAGHALQRG